jgi:hypothetical protein
VAKNIFYKWLDKIRTAVGTGVVSGDPVLLGRLPGVATESYSSADGKADVQIPGGPVYDLSVKAINEDGNSAVAVGDPLYYVDGDTPPISKKQSGVYYGIALETVSTGGTATINVLLDQSPGGAPETGGTEARDVLLNGTTYLNSWQKSTDLTKIDGAKVSDGTIPAAALAAGAWTADQVTISGEVTLDEWRKEGDLEKIDGAKVSAGTIVNAAIATAANIAPSKILLEGVTTLDTWQKDADLTKIDGAKVSNGTLPLAALATALRSWYSMSFHFNAADIADGDILTDMTLPTGMTGEIVKVYAVVTKAITTDEKAANINFEINTTNLTGGVIALSGTYAAGAVIEGSAITAANVVASEDEISIEAAGVTPFIEGEIEIVVVFKTALV